MTLDEAAGLIRLCETKRQAASEHVLVTEKMLELAKDEEFRANHQLEAAKKALFDLVCEPRESGRSIGDVFRDHGVPGYENWKRQ